MKNIELVELLERRLADSIVVRESWNATVESAVKLGESLIPATIEYHRAEGAVLALRSAIDLLRGYIRYEEEKQAIANAQNPKFFLPPENPDSSPENSDPVPPAPKGGWPDRPGMPPEPEKHRFHWIKVFEDDYHAHYDFQVAEWWPEDEAGENGAWFLVGEGQQVSIVDAAERFEYVGSVTTPQMKV